MPVELNFRGFVFIANVFIVIKRPFEVVKNKKPTHFGLAFL
jgi:hypothetical protein